jgi:hypothetical protein
MQDSSRTPCAVVDEDEPGAQTCGDPSCEREERDADVVGEDRARERCLLRDREAEVPLPRFGGALELLRHETQCGGRVDMRPPHRQPGRQEHQYGRGPQQPGSLPHPLPVGRREERQETLRVSFGVVNERSRGPDECLETRDHRITWPSSSRQREIRSRYPVEPSQLPDAGWPELLRLALRLSDQLVESEPLRLPPFEEAF